MIASADEFIHLRTSERPEDDGRAAHDEAPIAVWWQLVREHPAMKIWVAHNKTVPLEILEALATDADANVRDAVARKRKATAAILARLARDADESVRLAVAWNRSTPRDVLALLVDDPWHEVADQARARLREPS